MCNMMSTRQHDGYLQTATLFWLILLQIAANRDILLVFVVDSWLVSQRGMSLVEFTLCSHHHTWSWACGSACLS